LSIRDLSLLQGEGKRGERGEGEKLEHLIACVDTGEKEKGGKFLGGRKEENGSREEGARIHYHPSTRKLWEKEKGREEAPEKEEKWEKEESETRTKGIEENPPLSSSSDEGGGGKEKKRREPDYFRLFSTKGREWKRDSHDSPIYSSETEGGGGEGEREEKKNITRYQKKEGR